MNAWTGLLKKEFRQIRVDFLILLGFMVVLFALFYYGSTQVGEYAPTMFSALTGMVIGAHIWYFPVYMWISLHKESKQMQLWLHNPQSGYMLLGAKLLNGLIAFLISLAVATTVFLVSVPDLLETINVQLTRGELLSIGSTALLNILQTSVFFGAWIVFLWVVYRFFASRIGKLSIFAILAVIIAALWGFDAFSETQVYDFLTQWGPIEVFPSSLSMSMNAMEFDVQTEGTMRLYTGFYVFQLGVAVILFLVSGWLLDKRVEV